MEGNLASNALKKSIKVTVTGSNLLKLKEINMKMTKEARSCFEKKYGRILDLLFISVEKPVLSALVQFWSPSLRCFELLDFDLVPTIEEYEVMIRLPIRERVVVYLYEGRHVEEKKVARMIGISADEMKLEKRGSVQGLKKSFLETHLETLAKQGDWGCFNKTLALAIYGLVLFPFTPDLVDHATMDVFYQYETVGANPIPAILADTFISLEICQQKKGGMLRCCSHMLQVWIIAHIYDADYRCTMPDPLRSFHCIRLKKQEAWEWKKEFFNLDLRSFTWVCPWYFPEDIIVSCGDFPNVPLIGPRGCVAYTPAMALRQFKRTQIKPKDKQLGGLSFLYGGTHHFKLQAMMSWGNQGLLHLLITRSGEEKGGYKAISSKRIACNKEASEETIKTLELMNSQLEIMKAQMILLEEKKDRGDLDVITLKKRCRKMDIEIERLKDECADAYQGEGCGRKVKCRRDMGPRMTPSELKKKLEEQEGLMAEISQEKKELEARNQVQDIRLERLQGNVAEANRHADKGWEIAKKYHDLLVQAREKEEKLKSKIEELENPEICREGMVDQQRKD
ncbi:hypothetical protein SESBI_30077 [Sesbania bispinosa]|nr:hypothetical protein SESBI_30077 [Sesbania bispinosa]